MRQSKLIIALLLWAILPAQAQIALPDDCPHIQGAINVTDLWYFMRFMPEDTPTHQNAMNLFKPYRIRKTITHPDYGQIVIVDVGGNTDKFPYVLSYPRESIGQDGYPHPICGVWLIPRP